MPRTEREQHGSTDQRSRDAYARLLRRFMSGRVTNFEYEDQFDRLVSSGVKVDPAVYAIHGAMWNFYCDLHEHRMTDPGRRVSREGRRRVAQWILFLSSDIAYAPAEWAARHKARFALQLMLLAVVLACPILFASGLAIGIQSVYALILSGIIWVLAVVALRALGFVINPAVAERIALMPASDDPWPFPSTESLKTVLESPRLLAGGDDKDSSRGATALT